MKSFFKKIKLIIKYVTTYKYRFNYNEEDYLYYNHDVYLAVKNNIFRDGYEHYCRYGREEGRKSYNPEKNYTKWLKLKKNKPTDNYEKNKIIYIFISKNDYDEIKLKNFYKTLAIQKDVNWKLLIHVGNRHNNKIDNIYYDLKKYDKRILIIENYDGAYQAAISEYVINNKIELFIPLFSYVLFRENSIKWFLCSVNSKSGNQIIYSDNDLIDDRGNRHSPNFKSDWNKEFYYSNDMAGECVLINIPQTEDVDVIRFLKKCNSIDHFILLTYGRFNIKHVDEILYSCTGSKVDISERIIFIKEHLNKLNIKSNVTEYSGGIKVSYEIPHSQPKVDIIIPTKNGYNILSKCIKSIIKKTDYQNYKIIIIDNGSDDIKTLKYLERLSRLGVAKVLKMPGPFNFSKINNEATKNCDGDILAFLNDDIEIITESWLTEMTSLAIRNDVGAVGARLWYPDGRLQHGGVILGIGGAAGHAHKFFKMGQCGYQERINRRSAYSAVTGACLVVQRNKFNEVGGFDSVNLKVAYNDIDFCLKLREIGYENIWTPFAEMYHHESISRGHENTPEKIARFNAEKSFLIKKWGYVIRGDPFYNKNLSRRHEDYSYNWTG